MINNLAQEIHANNIQKGFYEKEKNIGEMLCLIHSEVSEALEADRKDRYANEYGDHPYLDKTNTDEKAITNFLFCYEGSIKGTFEDEMADIVIRALDMCAYKKIDLEKYIAIKMRYNSMRPKYHGKKY